MAMCADPTFDCASETRAVDAFVIKHLLFRRISSNSKKSVIHPKQRSSCYADGGHNPPDPFRLMRNFSEVMHQCAAEPPTNQRSDSDRQKRKTHISALLSGRRKQRDVFVIAR